MQEWGPSFQSQSQATTYKRYLCSLDQIGPYVEGRKLSEINAQLVGEIVRERQKAGVLPATIKRDLGALSSVMNFAIVNGWCESNPVLPRMKLIKEKRDPIVLPRDEDIELMISRAPGMWPQLIRAAWATGAREDELIKATRGDFNRQRKELTVIGKGNNVRVIDLVPFGGFEIFDSLPVFVGKENLFWRHEDKRERSDSNRPTAVKGDPITDPGPNFARYSQRVEVWAADQGITFRKFRFHDLRHKHAVDWLQAGRSIYDLQRRLGHSSVKTTEVYLDYITGDQERVVKYGQAG